MIRKVIGKVYSQVHKNRRTFSRRHSKGAYVVGRWEQFEYDGQTHTSYTPTRGNDFNQPDGMWLMLNRPKGA